MKNQKNVSSIKQWLLYLVYCCIVVPARKIESHLESRRWKAAGKQKSNWSERY